MNELPQQLANGLLLGSMYGLIAIGYTMVYGIVQLINFAHGEIFMTGGFGALTVYFYILPDGTSMALALPLMLIGGGIVAVLIAVGAERFAYRPLRGAPRLAPLITAIGLSLALQQVVCNFYPDARPRPRLPRLDGTLRHRLPSPSRTPTSSSLIAAPVCMAALALLRPQDPHRPRHAGHRPGPRHRKLMGIDTNRIIVIAFAIGGALRRRRRRRLRPQVRQIDYRMGFLMGLKAFTAAVLGGIGNIYGAMLGGVVLGIAEALATAYIDDIPGMEQFGGGAWKDVWAFVLLILVLLVRPQGLLGERVADRA